MLLLSPRMESSQSRLREASNQGEPRASCCAPSHATARVSSWATVLAACPVRRGPPAHRCFPCFEHGRGHQALSASALYRARGGNHLQTARPWASWARAWRSPRRSIGVASRPYQCAAERAGGRAGRATQRHRCRRRHAADCGAGRPRVRGHAPPRPQRPHHRFNLSRFPVRLLPCFTGSATPRSIGSSLIS